MLRDVKTILIFLLPALVIYVLFVPAPVVASLVLSLYRWNLISPPHFAGFENFIRLFTTDSIFQRALLNTTVYLLVSILLQLPAAFLFANFLQARHKGTEVFRNVFFLPVTLSSVAVSLMWYFIYQPNVGLLNQAVRLFAHGHHFDFPWLANENTALVAVTVSVAWQWIGYHMVIDLAGMSAIPDSVLDSARIDGANATQLTFRIILPYLLPMIAVSLVLITTSSLRSFDQVYIMTQGGPNHATEVLASYMYYRSFTELYYGYGSAIGFVLLVLSAAATLLIRKIFDRLQA